MENVQTLVKARPEADARALIQFAAFASFVIAAVLWFGGHRQEGIPVGIWVPSILSLGAIALWGASDDYLGPVRPWVRSSR